MTEEKERGKTFKEKTINELEEFFDLTNAEEVVEDPKPFARQIRDELNWYRSLLQFLEMYMEWSDVEIEGQKVSEMNFVWNKEPFYRTKYWKKRRREILDRDNYECQRCGITQKEHRNKGSSDKGLEVHHIKPRLEFTQSERKENGKANDSRNLIVLCSKCHGKMEPLSENEQREVLEFFK